MSVGFMKRIQIGLLIVMMISLSACNTWWNKEDEDKNPYVGMTAEQLYSSAQKELKKGQYTSAAKHLEALDTMYPFSDYTENAQIQLIYAYYQDEDYPSSAASADRFIQLYPRAKRVDYAYYMKGLANFQQTRGVFAKMLPMDESWRDPGTQNQAYADFSNFIQRFPDSKYKPNALQRMIYLRNMFAQHELNVSQFYFKRRMYVAAIERSSYLVKNYPQAPSVGPALEIMYKSNKILGLNSAAEEALKVYQATFHKSMI